MLTQIEDSQNPFRLGNYWILGFYWCMILNTPKVQCSKFCRVKCLVRRSSEYSIQLGKFISYRFEKSLHIMYHSSVARFRACFVVICGFRARCFTTSNLVGFWAPNERKPICFTIQLCLLCQAAMAELIAMTLFVIIGCGAACANGASDSSNRLQVALAFGMGILVLAYSIGHHSGGQINCAVTLSLVLGGQVPWYQGLTNLVAQLLGSLLGAGLLCGVFPCEVDATKSVGTNIIDDRWGVGSVLLGEFLGTFILCFVVWETAVSPLASCGKNACIAIGFAVFLAHVILLPVDGCSINPTRSFGPAIVGIIRNCDGMSTKGLEEIGQKLGKGGQRCSKNESFAW